MMTKQLRIMVSVFATALLLSPLAACTEVSDGDLLYALTGEWPEDTQGSSSGGGGGRGSDGGGGGYTADGGGGPGCVEDTIVFCISECEGEGKKECDEDGTWGPCLPIEEICGNIQDDDCDGSVDEEECGEPGLKGYFEGCLGDHECEGELGCVSSEAADFSSWCTKACGVDTDCPVNSHCNSYCEPDGEEE